MGLEDRERSFEKALSRHLRGDAPQEPCPGAETLAAYHERSLAPEEQMQWKYHIAECARCQEILSQLERTEGIPVPLHAEDEVPVFQVPFLSMESLPKAVGPLKEIELTQPNTGMEPNLVEAAPAAPPSVRAPEPVLSTTPWQPAAQSHETLFRAPIDLPAGGRSRPWRWLVPAGAIAAGFLIWGAVHQTNVMQRTAEVAANRPQPTPPAVTPAGKSADNLAASLDSSGKAVAPDTRALERYGTREKEKLAAKPSDEVAEELRKPLQAPGRARMQTATSGSAGAAVGGLAPPRLAQSVESKQAETKDELAAPSAPQGNPRAMDQLQQAAPPAAPTITKEERDTEAKAAATPAPAPPPVAETVTVASDMAAKKPDLASRPDANRPGAVLNFDLSEASNVKASGTRTVRAPGGVIQWIIDDKGIILRSMDGGKEWEREYSGVSVPLYAGSSVSDTVCWVVGAEGTVLLTMDGGKHWQKVPSPTTADLIGISARDAQSAAVWSDARLPRYITRDGGKTWQQPGTE